MAVLTAFGFTRTVQPILTYILSGLVNIQSGRERVGYERSELTKRKASPVGRHDRNLYKPSGYFTGRDGPCSLY